MNAFSQRPKVLKHQFRWKLVPRFCWNAVQSVQIVVLMSILITAGCVGYLWQWANYREIAHEVQSLERQRAQLKEDLDLLEVEVQFLTRPQRLNEIASKHLNLSPPKLDQFAYLEEIVSGE